MYFKVSMLSMAISFASAGLAVAQHDQYSNPKDETTYILRSTELHGFPDSVRIEFPDQKVLMIFQFKNITRDLEVLDDFQKQFKVWLAQINSAVTTPSSLHRVQIKTKDNGESELTIEEPQLTTRIKSDSRTITELLPPGWEIDVTLKNAKVYVYTQTLKDLESAAQQNFGIVREHIQAEIVRQPLRRKGLSSRWVLQDNKITYSEVKRKIAGDFLELNAGAGFGFMGDKFYPELDFIVELRFANRYRRDKHKVSFLYQNLFFAERKADGGYSNNTNSFLSVALSENLNSGKGAPQWLGLGAGYLIEQKGNYFTGKTAKFFIMKTIGHFTITPEVYLTNDFKSFQTGIKLGYTF